MPAKKATKKAAPKSTKRATAKKPQYTVRNVAVATLGFYGKVFDELQDRVSVARKDVPKTFEGLVKRGEKAQKELNKARKELRKNIEESVEDTREQLEVAVDRVRDTVSPSKA
ncbi:MAG: hypothetical protein AAF542_04040 [Pseudomonadota bacterium]